MRVLVLFESSNNFCQDLAKPNLTKIGTISCYISNNKIIQHKTWTKKKTSRCLHVMRYHVNLFKAIHALEILILFSCALSRTADKHIISFYTASGHVTRCK